MIPLFLVSAAAVAFEVQLTRYFSVASWSEYGYWIISITMTGFAISGVFLSLYALGCHSLRHRWGGWMDQLSRAPVRSRLYPCVSCLNAQHMRWAWCSLFSVMFADVYVRLCAMGVWHDWRIIG